MKTSPVKIISTCLAGVLLLAGTTALKAANTTYTLDASGNWSAAGTWLSGNVGTGVGNIATENITGLLVTNDQATTIGSIREASSGGHSLTIYSDGNYSSHAITLDGTGITTGINSGHSSVYSPASTGTLTVQPSLVLANTDCDLGLTYGTAAASASLTIGVLSSSTITASSARTINLYNRDGHSGGTGITINSSIGATGSPLAINNLNTSGINGYSGVTINGACGPNISTITENTSSGSTSMTINGLISGSSAAITATAGSLYLNNAANSYGGLTTINGGTLILNAANSIPSGSSVSLSSGTLNLNGKSDNIDGLSGAGGVIDATVAGTITLGIGNNNSGGTFSGVIQNTLGTLSLTKSGTGTEVLSGANTYSGTTTINAGILNAGVADSSGSSGPFGKATTAGSIVFGGGTLQYSSANNQDYSSRFSTAASQAFKIDVNGQTVSFGTALASSGGSLAVSDSAGGGSLVLNAAPTGIITYTVNGTLDVSGIGGTLSLVSGQTLGGRGKVSGSVYAPSGAHTRPGAIGVTNTITGNLTYDSGAYPDFDLTNSATTGPNDQIVLSGGSSVLTAGGNSVRINLTGADLDSSHDYVLFQLTGGSASISGSFNATPVWLGTVPSNPGNYTVVTDTVKNQVRLHYNASLVVPTVSGSASPATVVRGQSTLVSVTATSTGGTVTNVYLDLTGIGGANYVQLYLSGVANVWTNTISIPVDASLGGANVTAYATDTQPATGFGYVALTMVATNETWNGASSSTANWSDGANWASSFAPGLVGDSITFDGSTQTSPNMDNSYSVTALTFSNTASSFTVSSASSGVLTLTGPVVNNSSSAQILNVPIVLSGTRTVNTAAGNITYGGAVTGGSLTKVGNYTLYLGSSGNAYSGVTTISNGIISLNNNAAIGTNTIILAGGTLASGYGSGTRLQVGSSINVPAGYTGSLVMSALNRQNGSITGSGILNINAPGTQDDLYGNANTYTGPINIYGGGTFRLYINGGSFTGFDQAAVTLTNETVSVSDNSYGNTINVGSLIMDSTATIAGSIAGSSPNFSIGALNQNDLIAGAVQSSTRITKVGTGNLTIASASGTATYTGQTLVNGGTLTVLGTISASPLTNYSGTMLTGNGSVYSVDLEAGSRIYPGVSGTGTLTCGGGLTFNGGTNVVAISGSTVSNLIAVTGGLNLNSGAVQLNQSGSLANGTYPLIQYDSLTGNPAAFTLNGFSTSSGQTARLAINTATSPNEIDLVIETPSGAHLNWAALNEGAANGIWDVANNINWTNTDTASLGVFHNGDHVTFNDTGAADNGTVNLQAVVQPSTTVVTGTLPYVFESTFGGGELSGATNSLAVSGTGSLELDMVNDYGGQTSIGSGYTLTVGNGNDSASLGTGSITDNGSLVFNQTNNLSVTNISGSGSLTKNGANTLTLASTYTYTGATTIGVNATLQVGTNGPTGLLLGVVANNGTLILDQSSPATMTKAITGTGNLTKIGSSTLTLNVTNTYLGNTAIENGVLKAGATNVIPSAVSVSGSIGWFILDGNATTNAGTFDMNGYDQTVNLLQGLGGTFLGDITNGAASLVTNTLAFGNDFGSPSTTYAGLITENTNLIGGKIALVKQGASTNVLTGANSFSGGTIVKGGTLTLGNSQAAGTGSITLNDLTTLILNSAVGNTVNVAAGATATNSVPGGNATVLNGAFTSGDAGSTLVIVGSPSVGQGSTEQFGGFAGTVLIPSGNGLRFSATTLGDNGGTNTTFDVEGGLNTRNLMESYGSIKLGALTGAGTISGGGTGTVGNDTYAIGAKGIDSTFAGTIANGSSDTVSIIKAGAATLTLSGVSSYTGNTTISAGTLTISGSGQLGSGAYAGNLTNNGIFNYSSSAAQTLSGVISGTGALIQNGGGTLTLSGANTYTGNTTVNAGTLELTQTNLAPTSTVTVAGGATLQLDFTTTNRVAGLVLGGSTYSSGVFNSGNSSGLITGPGSLLVTPAGPSGPARITNSVSGNTLTLTWPAGQGWRLVGQTNNLSAGLTSSGWGTVTAGVTDGSAAITINPANPTVFYKLVYP